MERNASQKNEQFSEVGIHKNGSLICSNCKKEMVSKDLTKSEGSVLKTRLVFFGKDGSILGKCKCGEINWLPYRIVEEKTKKKSGEPD